jgi:hypothetical protein
VVIDSGAGIHLTPIREFITNMRPLAQPLPLAAAFGTTRVATHVGDGVVPIGTHTLRVPNLIYMPELKDTLLSYVRLTRDGHQISVAGATGTFADRGGGMPLRLSCDGNILTFDADSGGSPYAANAVTRSATRPTQTTVAGADATTQPDDTATELPASHAITHARYGHLCFRKLTQLATSGVLGPGAVPRDRKSCEQHCDACHRGKMVRVSFGDEFHHTAHRPNHKVVADVCGPLWSVRHADGTLTKYYMSTVTDVYSRHLEVLIIDSKDQASDHCISYFHRARIVTRNDMAHFHTDGGTEYNRFEHVANARGTKCTRTPVDTPQWNAIAERKNRTIIEMARALLFHANLDPVLYGQAAIETAVAIHNRCTIVGKTGRTMHELFHGHAPDISRMRVFGCDAFVLIREPESKLSARSEKGIFIGYDVRRELCYRVKIGGSDRVVVSRDVQFNETSFTIERDGLNNSGKPSAQPTEASRAGENETGDGARAMSSKERTAEAISGFGESIHSAPQLHATSSDTRKRAREPASADQGGDASSNGGAGSPVAGSDIDRRTRARLAASEAQHDTDASPTPGGRRTGRTRNRTRQTGLNLDDFGHVALAVSRDVPTSLSLHPIVSDVSQATESTSTHAPATMPTEKIRASDVPIPSTRRAALKSHYAEQWRAAMDQEYASIVSHGTFDLVARPAGSTNLVSCKWVLSVKEKDGLVVRFKARLVARGFTQEKGVDFEETYSPVLKYKTLRVILAIVAQYRYQLEVMDVQTAYLHASLKETVYMAQPEGYEQQQSVNSGGHESSRPLVCLLRKALYGLKQAGREWNIHLDAFVQSLGFKRCVSDTCLYVKTSATGRPMILSVYVDDIPSAYAIEDSSEWGRVKAKFFAEFKISFQAEADWLLNMRITRDPTRNRLLLDQQAYVETMLEDLRMDDCKPADTPGAQEELSLLANASNASERAEMATVPYRRAVGLLMYLSNTSRPDITHAVGMVARYSNNPGPAHWRAVKQILRYLSGTAHYGLLFAPQTHADAHSSSSSPSHPGPTDATPLTAFADADWGGCLDTRRSTTGWVLQFGGSLIDWSSKKQSTVALSSCEAEYMAITEATQAVMWAKHLLHEIGLQPLDATTDTNHHTAVVRHHSIDVFNDNKSAIAMAHNDVHHKRSKHIRLRYHFVREAVESKIIALRWCSTHDQVADILTKALPRTLFTRLRDALVCPRTRA